MLLAILAVGGATIFAFDRLALTSDERRATVRSALLFLVALVPFNQTADALTIAVCLLCMWLWLSGRWRPILLGVPLFAWVASPWWLAPAIAVIAAWLYFAMLERRRPALRALLHAAVLLSLELALLPMLIMRYVASPTSWTPAYVSLAALLTAVALAFGGWAALHFIRTGGTPDPLDPPPILVRSGPYRFMRHPIQVAEIGLAFVPAIATGRAALWGYGLCFTAILIGPMRAFEVAMLRRRFPHALS
jgi:protein-S-isoprenylcysteine O-methyltransferase Ste14